MHPLVKRSLLWCDDFFCYVISIMETQNTLPEHIFKIGNDYNLNGPAKHMLIRKSHLSIYFVENLAPLFLSKIN